MDEIGRYYAAVSAALHIEYEGKKQPHESVEEALSFKIAFRESFADFADKADRAYKESAFSEEQKMSFLNKAAVLELELRIFLLLHAPTTYQELATCLKNLHESRRRFTFEVNRTDRGAPAAAGASREENMHAATRPRNKLKRRSMCRRIICPNCR